MHRLQSQLYLQDFQQGKIKKLIYEALNEQTILQENTGLITVAGEYFHAELDAE